MQEAETMEKIEAEERKCTEETVIPEDKRKVKIKIDGKSIPIGKFVQSFIMQTIAGMLSSLKKVEIKDGSEIEIKIKYSSKDSKGDEDDNKR